MTNDNLGWLGTLILIVAIVLGFMKMYSLAWVVIAIGVAVIVYAKLKK